MKLMKQKSEQLPPVDSINEYTLEVLPHLKVFLRMHSKTGGEEQAKHLRNALDISKEGKALGVSVTAINNAWNECIGKDMKAGLTVVAQEKMNAKEEWLRILCRGADQRSS